MVAADRDDARRALATVRAYLDALAARDFSAACELLTGSVRDDLVAFAGGGVRASAGDCAEALELLLGQAASEALTGELAGLPLGPVRIAAESAEVDVPSPESPVQLRWDGDGWRISRLRSTATGRVAARLEAIEPL